MICDSQEAVSAPVVLGTRDIVAVGAIVSTSERETRRHYRMKVSRYIKGSGGRTIGIATALHNCGAHLSVGERVLVHGSPTTEASFETTGLQQQRIVEWFRRRHPHEGISCEWAW